MPNGFQFGIQSLGDTLDCKLGRVIDAPTGRRLIATDDVSDRRPRMNGSTARVAFAPAAGATWPRVEHPVVKALWVADFYATLIESGSANINWNEMLDDCMLSADRKTSGPVFFGLQMLHTILRSPGTCLVDARSTSQLISIHAANRRDGYVGLMLINKDPQSAATVSVTFKNGKLESTGRRIDYAGGQSGTASKLAVSTFSAPGDEFTVTVPPYTITDILLPNQK